MSESERIRLLLIAEACNPRWTSVPLVGYNYARALCERADLDVTLVTQVRNREALEADPIASLAPITYIDNEAVGRPIHRLSRLIRGGSGLSWTTGTAFAWPAYMVFEKMVHRRFADRLERADFDVIHRVTPLTPTMGSPLASLTDVPMILGPLNGGLPWPREYPELRRREREWLVPLRGFYKKMPYYRSTYLHLAAVIAGSRHTAGEIPADFRGLRFYQPENGIDPERFASRSEHGEPGGRFRFVTVGRLVPYKGVDLILEAMARSERLRGCELWIIGDGPQRPELEARVAGSALGGNVTFLGWLDQRELGRRLAEADAFAFPSLREFGGGVVLEAMACGLPVVVVDYGGPGELATPECGMRIPMSPRETLVPALAESMEALASDRGLARRLGEAARRRALTEFTWAAKADQVVTFYRAVLEHASPAPTRPRPAAEGQVAP